MFKIKALLFTLSILLLTLTSKSIDPVWESFYSGHGDNSELKMVKEAATMKQFQLLLTIQEMFLFAGILKGILPMSTSCL